MSNLLTTLTIAQLKRAVTIKEKIAELEGELASLIGATAATSAPAKKKGGMSAAGRAAVAAAQKARWAKIKGLTKPNATPAAKPAKKKFTMSASAKAAISKAAKARWAKIKAAKKA